MFCFRYVGAGAALLGILAALPAQAKPAFAVKEGKACGYCHVNPDGGGARTFRGAYYKAHALSFAGFDEEFEARAAGVKADAQGKDAAPVTAGYPKAMVAPPVLNFTMNSLDGKPVNLARYKGNVIMMVNVASKCGNTPQYASLQKLYDKYKSRGFVVLGFPANEFGSQEPGSDGEIKEFCTKNYGVTFPMFSKIVVKGEKQAPLYKLLTDAKTDPKFAGDIEWNFAKFLIDRNGNVVARIKAGTNPMTPEVVQKIEAALGPATSAAK